jgi:hypothetical protein
MTDPWLSVHPSPVIHTRYCAAAAASLIVHAALIVALVLLALRHDGSERWWMFSLDRLRRFMYRPDQY